MEEGTSGLAKKLDEDFDEFLSKLKPREQGKEAWPEDKWEEEMEKHPLFMTKPVEEGQELPPLVEAMQQLKFDPDQNTPEELATAYKEEGNEYFKLKKYRWAVTSYTEALKANSEDNDLNAIIYTNRAAAQFRLGNIQKALKDSTEAINQKSDHVKAIHRAAQCSLKLKEFDDCLLWCQNGLKIESQDTKSHESFKELMKEASESKKMNERDKRKMSAKVTQEMKNWDVVKNAIQSRGINLKKDKNFGIPEWWPSDQSQSIGSAKVHLNDQNSLIWPVLILYPEYCVSDFIQHFHEDAYFNDHFQVMFAPGNEPSWDKDHKYNPTNFNVYYGNEDHIFPVSTERTLKDIITSKNFCVFGGVPVFFITVKNSKFDNYWRKKCFITNEQ